MNSTSIIIFGATGNLYGDKLAKAVFLLFEKGEVLKENFRIIGFGRRDFTNEQFRTLSKEYILKKGKLDEEKIDKFLEYVFYFKGDFEDKDDFEKLKNLIIAKEDELVIFHLATASFLYEKIFENIREAKLNELLSKTRIMIEKPFGENETHAKKLQGVLYSIFNEEDIYHIDHYLAKETAIDIFDFRFGDKDPNPKWQNRDIEKIKVIFNESNIVGSRGSYYDKTGAFRDVGENHMLELLALVLMDKPKNFDVKNIRDARANVLRDLRVDYKRGVIKGQYESYKSSAGVEKNSKTETFFRVFLKSDNGNMKDIEIELEGGKGLIDLGSKITPTTVGVTMYFKNGNKKEFKIQPVEGTVYESYIKVYNDVIAGNQTNFSSIQEIIFEWRIADDLLDRWKDLPLLIYKDGSDPQDIK